VNKNDEIQHLLDTTLKNYLTEKATYKTASKKVPSRSIVQDQLPRLFKNQPGIPNDYFVKGSIGEGNMTEHPWICFLDPDVSQKSVRIGFYVSLLTKKDMQGFYLSLNQGWTQYKEKYGTKLGKEEILKNSVKARKLLRSAPDFDTEVLDLAATGELGKGYERGNIYSKYYDVKNLPSDKELLDNIIILIGVHRELKGIVGNNILNIGLQSSESNFQKEVQESKTISMPEGPIKKPNKSQKTNSSTYARDPEIGKIRLQNSNYKCELDSTHLTFTSKSTSKPFLEVHHLVPMEMQDNYEYSLDVPENIIALCPNCHRKIHHSTEIEKQPLLDKLYKERANGLKARGIKLTLAELNTIYKQSELIEY
jgi:5-methylcytosine-specific restriction enzyme A